MIDDPWFYATAVVAVLLLGVAKGGLAGGIGLVAVPLMSLTIEPARAAAILLPILMLMDATALRPWWGKWDAHNLRTIAPGAVLGTVIGLATFDLLSPDALRVMVGSIALVFALRWWLVRDSGPPRTASYARGMFWSTLAGFTSFGVHAGGPPLHIYLLSQRLDKTTFQATTVAFFFAVNWLKLGPYAWLGQLDGSNLATSLLLAPLAPVGIVLGTWLHHRTDEKIFFRIVYASLVVLGLKLIQDGLVGG
ncbi:MAG: sulfite exporter TauE/SafE family protein [Deltaproteobacteria bacterium]|nr:sulfite exporter TauE/SafE family protein [Deltaproteobacteria bacterium]MBW2371005.1 sulfite exporter TauE/SafE family protein [Deltaproteobacteria bacterium]